MLGLSFGVILVAQKLCKIKKMRGAQSLTRATGFIQWRPCVFSDYPIEAFSNDARQIGPARLIEAYDGGFVCSQMKVKGFGPTS